MGVDIANIPRSSGLLTTDEKTTLDSLAAGGFLDTFAKAVPTYAVGVTTFREIDLGTIPALVALGSYLADSAVDGGGVTIQGGAWVALTRKLWANPSTTPWAIGFDIALPVPTTGKACYIGLRSAAGEVCIIGHEYGRNSNVNANTKMFFATSTAGGSGPDVFGSVIDGARHAIYLCFDTVTLTLMVDGVVVATSADLSRLTAQNCSIQAYSTDPGATVVSRIAVATVK